MVKGKRLKIEILFLIIGGLFGLLFLILTPPFQAPDEDAHFFRAYQLSEGHVFSKKIDGFYGDYLPQSVTDFSRKFEYLKFKPQEKTNLEYIKSAFTDSKTGSKKQFVRFSNTSVYSPVAYLPQSLFISVGKIFNFKIWLLFYLARLGNLLVFLITGYYVLKILPILKWPAFVILTLPMTLFLAASCSSDVVTISLSLIFVAAVIKYCTVSHLETREVYMIGLCSILLALIKPVYYPLMLLNILLIKKLDKTQYIRFFGSIFTSVLLFCLWNLYATKIDVGSVRMIVDHVKVSPQEQLKAIKKNPFLMVKAILKTGVENKVLFYKEMVGVLGWLDVNLNKFIYKIEALVMVLLLFVNYEKVKVDVKKRILFAMVIFLVMLLTFLSLYLSWSVVGSNVVEGIQGRYFLPIVLMFYLLFYFRMGKKRISDKIITISLFLGQFAILSWTIKILLARYY